MAATADRVGVLLATLAGVLSLMLAASLVSAQRAETQRVRSLATQVVQGAVSDQDRVEKIIAFVYEHVKRADADRTIDRSVWIQPPRGILGAVVASSRTANRFVRTFFEPQYENFLKPGALQVYHWGTDCAGASRLMIRMLKAVGIDASKLALHDGKGIGRHAVVEANVDGRMIIADPQHGYVYPLPDGRLATAEDLARHPDLARRFLKPKESPVIADFRDTKTMNWRKIPVIMPVIYEGLRGLIGDKVDRIPRPDIVELPKMMSAVLFAGIGLLLLAPSALRLRRIDWPPALLSRAAAELLRWRGRLHGKRQSA